MCGIAGYYGDGNRDMLTRMGRAIAHRGPDAEGYAIIGKVGLAHRRLSIVDLSPTGAQPMESDDGRITLVFNGEIYNHGELRQTHLPGVRFRGTSDTEVIVRLYEKFGMEMVPMLRGMFAFALFDARTGVLLLARDHMGKKPLYWARVGDTLIFGSELKALREHVRCPYGIDRRSLAQYLVYEYVPGPRTIYEGVEKLSPGGYLTYDGTELTLGRYHTHTVMRDSHRRDSARLDETLLTLMSRAVETRMVADVPVGVFLSGGLDSSAITYFAQQGREERVKTFSIRFEDPTFDESEYARRVAHDLGTEHHERTVGPKDLLEVIPRLPGILDEPMADSSIIPTVLLSEFASRDVKVALGGDGADELFYGYGTFYAHRVAMAYEHVPRALRTLVKGAADRLPVSHAYMSMDFKLKKFLSGFETTRARRNTYWLSAFTPEELPGLLSISPEPDVLLAPSDAYYRANTGDFWNGLEHEYLGGYLVEDILVKTDRASMAYGLEVRAPFLDLDIVDFALSLDPEHKLRGRNGKHILKRVLTNRLPDYVIRKPKQGFNIPIGAWIQRELKQYVTEHLLEGALVESGLFKQHALATLLASHLENRQDNRKKLWSLLVLELWMRAWERPTPGV